MLLQHRRQVASTAPLATLPRASAPSRTGPRWHAHVKCISSAVRPGFGVVRFDPLGFGSRGRRMLLEPRREELVRLHPAGPKVGWDEPREAYV